uniref:Putative secreted protein n=1 Tax=Ixodes ricinus TaxID=34613 RepID=A0A6B0UN61_IXORI
MHQTPFVAVSFATLCRVDAADLPLDELQCCLYISRIDHVEDVIGTKKKACRLVEVNRFIEQNFLLNYHQAASTENASDSNHHGGAWKGGQLVCNAISFLKYLHQDFSLFFEIACQLWQ